MYITNTLILTKFIDDQFNDYFLYCRFTINIKAYLIYISKYG